MMFYGKKLRTINAERTQFSCLVSICASDRCNVGKNK